jgi:phage-related minor tail protein
LNILPSANGNAFASGGAFTNSIVSRPTLFAFANGGTKSVGVMGEAGSEAIMPLTRTASGKLGVEAVGSGGGTQVVYAPTFVFGADGQMKKTSDGAADKAGAENFMKSLDNIVRTTVVDFVTRETRRGGMLAGAGAR